jgi:hypothetical protein
MTRAQTVLFIFTLIGVMSFFISLLGMHYGSSIPRNIKYKNAFTLFMSFLMSTSIFCLIELTYYLVSSWNIPWMSTIMFLYGAGMYTGAACAMHKYHMYITELVDANDDSKFLICLRNILWYSGLSWIGVYSYFSEYTKEDKNDIQESA